MEFIDLDDYILKGTGLRPGEIIRTNGEDLFRSVENSSLEQLTKDHSSGIVACGGGTAISSENRLLMEDKGMVVFLDVSFEICRTRI